MADPAALTLQILLSMELFADLSSDGQGEVLAAARVRHVPRGGRIFDQGDTAERAYSLVSGSVRISQSGSDGEQVIIRLITPGQTFGTAALFTDRHYPADARAASISTVASWSEDDLFRLMQRYPQIAMNVIRIVGKRLKETQERLRELATQRVEQRVARAVLRLAAQAGHSTKAGTAIEFPLRRKDVADIAGTSLHTASRILTAWEKFGFLVTRNQKLTICKPGDIDRIAEYSD